jgi:hypothetical protein
MTGRPDYDAGDLVVCVNDEQCRTTGRKLPFSRLSVFIVAAVWFERAEGPFPAYWCVRLSGHRKYTAADRFRRIDPKPPEFFAGKIETVQEDELV